MTEKELKYIEDYIELLEDPERSVYVDTPYIIQTKDGPLDVTSLAFAARRIRLVNGKPEVIKTDNTIEIAEHGYVKLIAVYGDDRTPAQNARMSTRGNNDIKTAEDDYKLARRLMKDRHSTPFEFVDIVLEMRLPIFVARQWVRHRTASISEESARYTESTCDIWVPPVKRLVGQSKTNKQGSDSIQVDRAEEFNQSIKDLNTLSVALYKDMVASGVTREIARCVLPVSVYTKWRWKCNLRNFFHLISLRDDPHAQEEIREYAQAALSLVEQKLPVLVGIYKELSANGEYRS